MYVAVLLPDHTVLPSAINTIYPPSSVLQINIKNNNLSTMLMATDQKQQKS